MTYVKTFPEHWHSNNINPLIAHENNDITYSFSIEDSFYYNDKWLYEDSGRFVLTRTNRKEEPSWHIQHDMFFWDIISDPLSDGYYMKAFAFEPSHYEGYTIDPENGELPVLIKSGTNGELEWITYPDNVTPDSGIIPTNLTANAKNGNIVLSGLYFDQFTWQDNTLAFDYNVTLTPFVIKFNPEGDLMWMNSMLARATGAQANVAFRDGDLIVASNYAEEGRFEYMGETVCAMETGSSEGCIAIIDSVSAKKLAKTQGAHSISQVQLNDLLINEQNELIIGGQFNIHIFDGIEEPQPGSQTGFVWKPDIEFDDNNDDPVNALQKQSGHAEKPAIYPNPAQQHIKIALLVQATNADVAIYSLTGRKLLEHSTTAGETTIDLTVLKNGTYIVVVTGEDEVWRERMVKRGQ